MAQALVPYPQYGYIFNNFEGSGTAYYQGLQAQLEKRFTKGLSFLAGYTLSSEYNNTSSGFTSFISNGSQQIQPETGMVSDQRCSGQDLQGQWYL